jgi:threonylcarbamoyladenosine tRNA methylthiotransferase MtaB
MRRHYTVAQYRKAVEYAVSRIPDLGLGTDIIVGFPGETDQSFQNTLDLITELPFTNLHVFSYSKRRGTPAADMPDQIDPKIKKERSAQLIALGKSKRAAFAKSFIGKEVSVLIEKNDETGKATGWTEEYLPTKIFNPNAKPNQIIRFTPTTTNGDILTQTIEV